MKDIIEYDKHQLKLMHKSVIFFEKNQIDLGSLVSTLEFLLSVLQSRDKIFVKQLSKEVGNLELINALEVCKEAGEEVPVIEENEKQKWIVKSILNLKYLIEKELNECECQDS